MADPDYKPTTAEVAAGIRSRTVDKMGDELGDFVDGDDGTRPTAEEAQSLIDEATDRIQLKVEDCADPNGEVHKLAKDAVILLAQMKIERSFFPTEVGTGRSPYAQISDEYDGTIKDLESAVMRHCGDTAGGDTAGSRRSSGSFPRMLPGLIEEGSV
jgi:hypothetical protein